MINQYGDTSNLPESTFNVGTIMLVTRLVILLVGLAITLFGIKYSLDIFLLIYDYLQQPETLAAIIEKWSVLLNIKGLIIYDYPMDSLFAIIILAVGALLLLRITLGFISAGTTILVNAVNSGGSANNANPAGQKVIVNLDYKLTKLKSLSEQGIISKQAYEETRDKYMIQKIMNG